MMPMVTDNDVTHSYTRVGISCAIFLLTRLPGELSSHVVRYASLGVGRRLLTSCCVTQRHTAIMVRYSIYYGRPTECVTAA